MERIVTEHEIKTEYNLIREIRKTYITVNGVERLWDTHRAPQHVPGKLEEDTYVKTSTTNLPTDVKVLADHFWTEEVHASFELLLKEQASARVDEST